MPATRKASCLRDGTLSERRFELWLTTQGLPFTVEVGTTADLKGKVDFVVNGKTVNVKAPTRSGPSGLCVEWRAVNGSVGWLHKVDFIVKFIDDKRFVRLPCVSLKEYVIAAHGIPPELCPQTGAGASRGQWYARKGPQRVREACIMIPAKEIEHLYTLFTI